MNKKLIITIITIAAAATLGGCASKASSQSGFGDAVRNTTMNQVYDKGAAVFTNADPVTGADPYRLENVVNTHRDGGAQQQGGQASSQQFESRSGSR
jgi:hypothetical protein